MRNHDLTDKASTLARRAARVEYVALRTPLQLADRLTSRLGEGSKVRATVRLGLHTLDDAAARFGAAPKARDAAPAPQAETQPGAETEPKAAPEPAPATEAAPEPAPEPTPESAPELAPEPAPEPDATADADLVELETERLVADQQEATFAGELDDDAELRRVQAELQAKRLVAEQAEEQQRRQD